PSIKQPLCNSFYSLRTSLGGVTSTLVLHPLDLIKIRFQGKILGITWFCCNDGSGKLPVYRGLVDAVQSIVGTGGLKGLYQGVTPKVWGYKSARGLYFFRGSHLFLLFRKVISPFRYFVISFFKHARTGTLTVTNPICVIRTHLCLQYTGSPAAVTQAPQYKGMIDALFKLWRHEGLRGLYKGYVPGLFGVSHGALQFMAYEELKKGYSHYFGTPINKKLSSTEYLIMASLSKIFAATATYPYQVVRSRLQNQYTMAEYNGAVDVIRKTFRYEGVSGFYKGLVPNVLR
ncbi:unnamed protein product, partial [Porites lobata]